MGGFVLSSGSFRIWWSPGLACGSVALEFRGIGLKVVGMVVYLDLYWVASLVVVSLVVVWVAGGCPIACLFVGSAVGLRSGCGRR